MNRKIRITGLLMLLALLAACASQGAEDSLTADEPPTSPARTDIPGDPQEAAGNSDEHPPIMTTDDRPEHLVTVTSSWNTDWTRHTVDYDEIISGGPPRDGIPSIDEPEFISFEEAADWLADQEPVIGLEIEGDARAYPLQILTWHEIVNDEVGGVPVVVTFCPLCNSALVFDRRVNGEVYEFGTSGLLRHSDLIMYDRTTESLWQQFTGEGIVGQHTGDRLAFIPSSIISFADFRAAYPQGQVLSQETGFSRRYGANPYVYYDEDTGRPFLFTGELDERLPAMMRVVGVVQGDETIAYPYSVLAEQGVIHDTLGGREIVIFHRFGTTSALGAERIAQAEDVGATGVFDRVLDGQVLTFTIEGVNMTDAETGSTWNVVGQAISGPYGGKQLTPVIHSDHFWFSWAAFYPNTVIYAGDS